jgi:hypothetical protein
MAQPTGQQQPMVPAPPAEPITFADLATLVGAPTVVTFRGTGVPVSEVRAAMLEAAGRDASAGDGPFGARGPAMEPTLKNVTVNWVEIPFWKAAQQIEEMTGARWSGSGPGGFGLLGANTDVFGGGPNHGMVAIAGLSPGDLINIGDLNGNIAFDGPYVKVIAKSLSSNRNATNEFSAANNGTKPEWKSTLTVAIYPDPKLRVTGNKVSNVEVQVAGKPVMKVERKAGEFDFMSMILNGVDRKGLLSLARVDLPPGLEPGTILESVSGTLQLNVEVNQESWKVADVTAKPADTFTAKGATVGIQNARIEEGKLKLRVTLATPPDVRDPLAAFRALTGITLRDGQGRKLVQEADNPNMNLGANNGTLGLDLNFKGEKGTAVEGPVSLEWKLAGQTRPLEVPFVLRDVKVP